MRLYIPRHLFERRWYRFWIMVLVMIIALIAFEEIVDDVFYDPLEGDTEAQTFDRAIIAWIQHFRSARLTQAMTDLTALGSVSVILTLFVIMASIMAVYKDYKGLSYLSAVLAGAAVWPSVLKVAFGRQRPPDADHLVAVTDLSFPSGHAFGATALYIALAYYAAQRAQTWAHEVFFYCLGAILIIVVSTSRIYLGVHYPTDVLAGLSAGAAWGLFVSAIYEAHEQRARVPDSQ